MGKIDLIFVSVIHQRLIIYSHMQEKILIIKILTYKYYDKNMADLLTHINLVPRYFELVFHINFN